MAYIFWLALFIFLFLTLAFKPWNYTQASCWSELNVEKVCTYVEWKDKTSKIGKVLVANYEVKLEGEKLLFYKKNSSILQFTVTKTEGIQMAGTSSKYHKGKAERAFCELLKYATLRGY
ncbi:MAG: hypothetical protein MUF42_06595 [Cytophagaceae bacterium]|jgi:hypothetical protein|nr:hypothetical protein [Cytophagaceae bacterium]